MSNTINYIFKVHLDRTKQHDFSKIYVKDILNKYNFGEDFYSKIHNENNYIIASIIDTEGNVIISQRTFTIASAKNNYRINIPNSYNDLINNSNNPVFYVHGYIEKESSKNEIPCENLSKNISTKIVTYNNPKNDNKVGFIFSCPGFYEEERGRVCAGKTGKNLNCILEILGKNLKNLFPSSDRYEYFITNA